MQNSLMNPNQLRAFGCIVQDNPYSGAPLYIEDPDEVVTVPFEMVGMNIFVTTRTPMQDELDTYQHVVLTSPREWEPTLVRFPDARWTIAEDQATR